MPLRDLVLLSISISYLSVSSAIVETQELSPRISSKPIHMIWNIHLQDLSDRWRMVNPEVQVRTEPQKQRENQVLDHKSELVDNFEYVDQNLDEFAAKTHSAADERKEDRLQDKIAKREKFNQLEHIIMQPPFCPEGQEMDSKGICRPLILSQEVLNERKTKRPNRIPFTRLALP
ncbi:uncharacterized protein LOC105191680 [Harpegnathos saltator]|uniref:Uncharacterized protein n=1 Tax=Harpegnathos saltator TaxID=610380 RepID=E2CAF3_HARSA|nr:uncharacterized protein LOC105191680 [Harpegnathos saltator]EFN75064.1 hypothetical protein EAI_07428 [Harpegnathos saltator]